MIVRIPVHVRLGIVRIQLQLLTVAVQVEHIRIAIGIDFRMMCHPKPPSVWLIYSKRLRLNIICDQKSLEAHHTKFVLFNDEIQISTTSLGR